MTKLRSRIIRYFISAIVLQYILTTLTDSMFQRIMDSPKGQENIILFISLNLAVSLSVLIIVTLIFVRFSTKAFSEEKKKSLERQNLLYASIAHDLKTPMTSVTGYATALKDKMVTPDEYDKVFSTIYLKSRQMNSLLDELFEYSKLSSEGYRVSINKTELNELIRECVILNLDELEKKNILPEVSLPDMPVLIETDREAVNKILNNLIINIARHNEDGIRAGIGLLKENDYITIYVADSGNPVDIRDKGNVFDPFVKSDGSRKSGTGSGLGLAVSRMLAEKLGGTLTLKEGFRGYTKAFLLELPNGTSNMV